MPLVSQHRHVLVNSNTGGVNKGRVLELVQLVATVWTFVVQVAPWHGTDIQVASCCPVAAARSQHPVGQQRDTRFEVLVVVQIFNIQVRTNVRPTDNTRTQVEAVSTNPFRESTCIASNSGVAVEGAEGVTRARTDSIWRNTAECGDQTSVNFPGAESRK